MAHNGVGERLHVYISSRLALCGLLPRKDNVLLVRTVKPQVCHRRWNVVSDEQTCSHLSTVAHAVCCVSGVVVNGSLHVAQVVNILHLLSRLCVCDGSDKLMVTHNLYVCDGRKVLSVKRLCRVCPRQGSLCCSVGIGHNVKVVKSGRCALCRSRERNVETAELRQRTDDSHRCGSTCCEVNAGNAVGLAVALNKVGSPIERAVGVVKLHRLIVVRMPSCCTDHLHGTCLLVNLAEVAVERDAVELSVIGTGQREEASVERCHDLALGVAEVYCEEVAVSVLVG